MSKILDKDFFDLLAKSISGEASIQERKKLEEMLEASDDAKTALQNVHDIWGSSHFLENKSELVSQKEANEEIWEKSFLNEQRYRSRNLGSIIIRIAATLIIFLSATFVIFFMVDKPKSNEPVVSKIQKQTLPGQKSQITLRDGTIVWLNSGSSIKYWTDYNERIRLVVLEGQAFFDVFKDPTRPFLVKCRDLEVEALGTSFDVNGYSDSPIQVSLVTGKVKLSLPRVEDADDEHILLPGEYSVLSQDNKFIEKGTFNSYDVLAWKEGRLIFDNATINEIVPKLELWYGVNITNEMTINLYKPFSATFEKENLDNILMNIEGVLQIDYEIEGNDVVIKNKLPM